MNKSELIEAMAKDVDLPVKTASGIVQTIIDAMADTLVKSENIEIRGLFSIKVKKYDSYIGRNPKTGVETKVPPKKLPFFKAGKELKEFVNAGKK